MSDVVKVDATKAEARRQVIEQWVVDLKSGEFPQAKNGLFFDGKSFCALGVAIARMRSMTLPEAGQENGYLSSHYLLTTIAGLTLEQSNLVAKMNDSGLSFVEIADWIEGNIVNPMVAP